MRPFLLLFFIIFLSISCFSQTEDIQRNNSITFRIDYQNGGRSDYSVDSTDSIYIGKSNRYFPLLRIGFQYNIKKNRFIRFGVKGSVINIFDDFEILVNTTPNPSVFLPTNLVSSDKEDQFKATNIKVGLFSEYGILLMNEDKFSIYVGIEAGLDYDRFKAKPLTSEYFELRTLNIGINANSHPIIRYDVSDKISIEAFYSFSILSLAIISQYIGNPALIENQRTLGGFDFDMLRFKNNSAGLTMIYRL